MSRWRAAELQIAQKEKACYPQVKSSGLFFSPYLPIFSPVNGNVMQCFFDMFGSLPVDHFPCGLLEVVPLPIPGMATRKVLGGLLGNHMKNHTCAGVFFI